MKHLGNGEGFTTLILTDAESRMIRQVLTNLEKTLGRASGANPLDAFNAGVKRATARIAEEFAQEQKRRKK